MNNEFEGRVATDESGMKKTLAMLARFGEEGAGPTKNPESRPGPNFWGNK